VALGERERGEAYLRRALDERPEDPVLLYNAGCVYALLNQCEDALECLEQSAARGVTQKGWYQNDSDLAPLRTHPGFRRLLAKLPDEVGPHEEFERAGTAGH